MKPSSLIVSLTLAGVLSACGPGEVPEQQPSSVEDVGAATAALDCAALNAPVYMRVRPATGSSLLTTNPTEATNAGTTYGFTDDRGTPFKASKTAVTGLSPVYRLYSPGKSEHIVTIDATERTNLIASGYTTDEGVGFYASKTADACLIPVYRFNNTSLQKHRHAVTQAERDNLTAAGWTSEGIQFYAAPTTAQPVDTKFTFVVIPDTQQETVYQPARLTHRMQWIADNKTAQDIRFVMHTGDLMDWDTADHIHYQRASDSFQVLDTAQIPYAIALGNHDTAAVCQGGSACPGNVNANLRNTTTFNTYFPLSRFKALGGVFETGKCDNAYHTFSAGGLNWLVVNLELWARTDSVNWAKTVLAQFPKHNVIFITHSHLNSSGGIEQSNGGYGNNSPQYVFNNLISQYANVRFVFSGHVGTSAYRTDTGVHGNTIYQMLNTYHDGTTNPTRLVEIDTAANTISTRVYAPLTNTERADGTKAYSNVNWVR
ncbi:metallophosphoesterase [Corallococcus sp. CA047B]|uniref:metallophosphoesterase n=1 Tax=Corallococcus sp. CA047B TaxID=2316729 RepID=UPI000EA3CDB5|nr:metallophosphoesterase [Corallococcus sp. CA047B]RKH01067.1 metallophosphoesterase [Corallococcus sp. CA047B]